MDENEFKNGKVLGPLRENLLEFKRIKKMFSSFDSEKIMNVPQILDDPFVLTKNV